MSDANTLTIPASLIDAAAEAGGLTLTLTLGSPPSKPVGEFGLGHRSVMEMQVQGIRERIDKLRNAADSDRKVTSEVLAAQAAQIGKLRGLLEPCGHTPKGWASPCSGRVVDGAQDRCMGNTDTCPHRPRPAEETP